MEVLIFLGGLIAVAGICVGLWRLNQYCEDKYGYKPTNTGVLLFEIIPAGCMAVSFLLYYFGLSTDGTNIFVLWVCALLLQIGLAWYLAAKTNWAIGIGVSILLFFVALLIAAVMIFIVLGRGKKKS